MRIAPIALFFVAACSPELSVPDDARIRCASAAECPTGTVCKQSLGLCVRAAGDDGRAPELVDVTLTPAVVTVGGALVLTLAADEQLGIAPDAAVTTGGHFSLADSTADAEGTYTLRYDVRGTESPGPQPVNVTLIDVFGNAAQLVGASVTFDFVAPRLGLARWTLPGFKRAVKPGDVVSLLVNIEEDAKLEHAFLYAGDVAIADVSNTFLVSATGDSGGLQITGDVTIPMDVIDGALLAVGFGLSDLAGNVTNPLAALSPSLAVDANPPTGTFTLPSSSAQSSVSATLTTDDAVTVRFEGDLQSPVGEQAPAASVVLLFTAGNGAKSVRAIFSDAAGNAFATPTQTITINVPPGAGSAGQPCATSSTCESGRCACSDAACTAQRLCAASASCGVCNYVNASGVCMGPITTAREDSDGCSAPRACAAGAVCKTARGQACSTPAECITGFCECRDASCSGRICADADCSECKVGVTCSDNRSNDTVCNSGQVCRGGACVVRNPGTCTMMCTGNLSLCSGPQVTSDNCNHAQDFHPRFTGYCPAEGPCRGSPACDCY